MSAERNKKVRTVGSVVLLATLLPGLTGAMSVAAQQPIPLPTTAFDRTWQRADLPVAEGRANRSWTWGPRAIDTRMEPLVEGKNKQRQVQYYDKSRMEINDPDSDPKSQWYVSNGLLVVEMISGRLQLGADSFEQRDPARIAVAGDTITAGPAAKTPSFATLAGVASLAQGQNTASPRIGEQVHEVLGPDGRPTDLANKSADVPRIKYFEPVTRHNIPDVFFDYMTQSGMVYENGQYRQGMVINWVYAMGYPITEPYWITVQIKGQDQQVMMQAFQRRLLTYNPANPAPWRVEMGNVGLQYFEWRYQKSPQPNPSPNPQGTVMNTRRVLENGPGTYSAIENETYKVVTAAGSWETLWKQHSANTDPPRPAPAVDFGKDFVVGAWWGTKPNGCYRLEIASVTLSGDTIRVVVKREQSQGACTEALTQPHDVHAVSKAGLTARSYRVQFVDTNGAALAEQSVTIP